MTEESKELKEGLPILVVGKKLVLEWVPMPTIDMSFIFLYRFLSPIATVWIEGRIPFSFLVSDYTNDARSQLKKFAEREWSKMILEGMSGKVDIEEWPPAVKSLLETEGYEEYECEIGRKK